MRYFLPLTLVLGLLTATPYAQEKKETTEAKNTNEEVLAQIPDTNPIVQDALLKTLWPPVVRNPFKFEVVENKKQPVAQPNEHLKVTGLGSFVDETGTQRHYTFLEKTTDAAAKTPEDKSPEAAAVDKAPAPEVLMLKSFPEILQDVNNATEEDSDQSSVTVGIERYWFIGIDERSAVFWVDGSAVTEDNLRRFSLDESIHVDVRKTLKGTKVKVSSDSANEPYQRPHQRKTTSQNRPADIKLSETAKGTKPNSNASKSKGMPDPMGKWLYGNPAEDIDMLIKGNR